MTRKLEDWQQRVVDEAEELGKRCDALVIFLESDVYEGLALVEQAKLTTQAFFMTMYYDVLLDRIGIFLGASK